MYKKTINKYNSNSKKIGTFFAIIVIITGIIILYFINIVANKYPIKKDFNLDSNYI